MPLKLGKLKLVYSAGHLQEARGTKSSPWIEDAYQRSDWASSHTSAGLPPLLFAKASCALMNSCWVLVDYPILLWITSLKRYITMLISKSMFNTDCRCASDLAKHRQRHTDFARKERGELIFFPTSRPRLSIRNRITYMNASCDDC